MEIKCIEVKFKKFDENSDVYIPEYKTSGSAGMDICAVCTNPVFIEPGKYKLINTNLTIELPDGYEAQIRSRSGLALKYGISVLNSPGTVDSDYRGEIKVLLINHGNDIFRIDNKDRIAQMIISKYEKVNLIQSETLTFTKRQKGGYGSTGKA
jgi:dUTP pyrophosphatase